MKAIDLDSIPYKLRFNGASLLISKAQRLCGLPHPENKGDPKKLLAAVAYYDMALALLKRFDPTYSTVVNWKCNLLQALGQYEDAVDWYREIIRISDEVDGRARRNPTAELADEMIQKLAGRKNEPLSVGNDNTTVFDDPPFCIIAEEFCRLLSEGKFKKAQFYLSPDLKETFPVPKLKAEWQRMTRGAKAEDINFTLDQHMIDWPDRKTDDLGWCYLSISSEEFNEAITVVVSRMSDNWDRITQLEFGRP